MPTSSPVHGEPALSGGVGVGAWVPPDDGEGMHVHVDSVTAVAGAGDGARSGVSGLDSGQVRLGEGADGAVLSAAHGASARPGAGHDEVMDVVGGVDRASDVPDSLKPVVDRPSVPFASAGADVLDLGHNAAAGALVVAAAASGPAGGSGQARIRFRGSKGRKRR